MTEEQEIMHRMRLRIMRTLADKGFEIKGMTQKDRIQNYCKVMGLPVPLKLRKDERKKWLLENYTPRQ